MKKAVIVVGSHYAGKSKTINEHLKPKLEISEHQHKFCRNGQKGYILSQSFEEAGRDVGEVIKKYSQYDLLVLAARPTNEIPSCLNEAIVALTTAGYRVDRVDIIKNSDDIYYENKANEILRYLDN